MAAGGKVRVELGDRSYDVHIGEGNLEFAAEIVLNISPKARAAVVADEKVAAIYGQKMLDAFDRKNIKADIVTIPSGELAKAVTTLSQLWNAFMGLGLDRKSVVVALGGGITGDLAGFAAGTFLRGIDYIQVPTTLLAQVDSSVGGKTGINLPAGKNLAGLFYQPRGVVIDVLTLKTLPMREVRAGLSEVIKYGVIWDEEFFRYLETHANEILKLETEATAKAIQRSVEIKAAVVSSDETENGLRQILNLGHTFAHALENTAGYGAFLHGEAVAWGMAVAARVASEMRMLPHTEADRIAALLRKLSNIPQPRGLAPEKIMEAARKDKKSIAGQLHYVLPEKIGRCIVRSGVDESLVKKIVEGHIYRG